MSILRRIFKRKLVVGVGVASGGVKWGVGGGWWRWGFGGWWCGSGRWLVAVGLRDWVGGGGGFSDSNPQRQIFRFAVWIALVWLECEGFGFCVSPWAPKVLGFSDRGWCVNCLVESLWWSEVFLSGKK